MSRWVGLVLFLVCDAAAAAEAMWLVSSPWPAPFSLEELAEALRLRLGDVSVRVVGHAPADAPGPVVELVEGSPVRIRLARRDRVLLDAPLPKLREGGARRAALLAVIALETAPSDPPAPISVAASPPPPLPRTHWAISAAVGLALAVDDSSASAAPALDVRARWFFSRAGSLDLGAKLSGAYEATSPRGTVSIVDRSVWLGAAAHLRWGSLGAAFGLAGQYTHPSIDSDAEGTVGASTASRFGVRASAELGWHVHENFALVVGTAATFAFAEREITAGGMELMELGSVGLDVAIGPEVRW